VGVQIGGIEIFNRTDNPGLDIAQTLAKQILGTFYQQIRVPIPAGAPIEGLVVNLSLHINIITTLIVSGGCCQI